MKAEASYGEKKVEMITKGLFVLYGVNHSAANEEASQKLSINKTLSN